MSVGTVSQPSKYKDSYEIKAIVSVTSAIG